MIIQPIQIDNLPIMFDVGPMWDKVEDVGISFTEVFTDKTFRLADENMVKIETAPWVYIYPQNKMAGLPSELLMFTIYAGEAGCATGCVDLRILQPKDHYYVKVDHNYLGVDSLRVMFKKDGEPIPVPGATFRAFKEGRRDGLSGETLTNEFGRWCDPMYLKRGRYQLICVGPPGIKLQIVKEINVF